MSDPTDVERFAGGGRVTGVIGLVIAAGIAVLAVLDPGEIPLPVVAVAVLVGVLIWSTMLKPQVSVADHRLVLRNMLETIRIPLAAIDELAVRQVLVVRVGEKRFVSPGVGRSVRQAITASRADVPQASKPALGPALGGGTPSQVDAGIAYADFVEHRIKDLAQLDRQRLGIRRYSDEAEALGSEVTREPAFVEIAALAASTAFLAVSILL
jgi:hypothetical protein